MQHTLWISSPKICFPVANCTLYLTFFFTRVLSWQTICLGYCPLGKWQCKITSPTGKSTCPGWLDSTFQEPWLHKHIIVNVPRRYGYFMQSLHISLLSYVNKVFSPEWRFQWRVPQQKVQIPTERNSPATLHQNIHAMFKQFPKQTLLLISNAQTMNKISLKWQSKFISNKLTIIITNYCNC